MTLSCDLSSSSLHIPRRGSADLCLHVVALRVHLCTAASLATLNLARIPSHDSHCAVSGIVSLVFVGRMPFNTQ
jgi:hypothetical protein